jgi:hypothetical protein
MESVSRTNIEYRPNESVAVPVPPVLKTLTETNGTCWVMSKTFPLTCTCIWLKPAIEGETSKTKIMYRCKLKLM